MLKSRERKIWSRKALFNVIAELINRLIIFWLSGEIEKFPLFGDWNDEWKLIDPGIGRARL